MNNKMLSFDERLNNLRETIKRQKVKKREVVPFEYKPFSFKQKQIITWWLPNSPVKDKEGIIADGAIRSGKTTSMSLSYGLWAMHMFNNQNFLICGRTVGSLRRNVVLDWTRQMRAQGFHVKERRTDNLLIVTKGERTNFFYLFGGSDERSQYLVQGITAAGAFFDEVALMPESFVNQATGRCSVDGSKFWFNCNPEGPFHWFKTNWINRIAGMDSDAVFDEENPAKNLLYLHFSMEDNLSLAEEIKARYRSMYSGVFFQRFILGLWTVASGLVYDMFDKNKHTHKTAVTGKCRRYIAIDYGTANPTVFLAIADDSQKIWVEGEYYYDSKKAGRQKDDSEYACDFVKFVSEWGYRPSKIVIDPSAASLKLALQKKGFHNLIDADNDVIEGIRWVSTLFTMGLLSIHEKCTNTLAELVSYIWDEKAAQRTGEEKPIKQQDHAMDALRYFVRTMLKGRFSQSGTLGDTSGGLDKSSYWRG